MPEFKEEIKAAIDEVRSKAGAEIAEKIEDSLISIVTKTNSMVTQSKELESEVKELRAEAYTKRHALKDLEKESQIKMQDYEDKIKSFENDDSREASEAELTRLRGFEKETIESQRTDLKSFVESVKDHDRFDKVSSKFKLPSNDDGIDFDGFTEMGYDDLKHNLTQMKDLKEIEYFDSTPDNKNTPPPGGKAQRGSDKTYFDRLAEAKTPRELEEVIKAG